MTILDEIIARRRLDVAESRVRLPEELLSRHARALPAAADFRAALMADGGGSRVPNIIAEIKKASPSKGVIRENFPVIELARELAAAGASALSVLTEPHWFQGALRNLRLVAGNVDIPVLCKDFIIDPYQIYQARVYGADAILLIAAALSKGEFLRLQHVAREAGVEVLAEVHNEAELEMVLEIGAPVIGVNSRDLKSFKVDLGVAERLLRMIPDDIVKVAESGVGKPEDVERLQAAGASAFLIGETLMRAASPGHKLRSLLRRSAAVSAAE